MQKKLLVLAFTSSTVYTINLKADFFSGISEAWNKTVEFSKETADSTVEISKKVVDTTGEVSNNVAEKSSEVARDTLDVTTQKTTETLNVTSKVAKDTLETTSKTTNQAIDVTTQKTGEAWDKTKITSKEAWDKTKITSKEAWDKTSEATMKVANAVRENAPLYLEKSLTYTKEHKTEIIVGAIIIVAMVYGIPPQAMTFLDFKNAITDYSNNRLDYTSFLKSKDRDNLAKVMKIEKELEKNKGLSQQGMALIVAENIKQNSGVLKSDLTGKAISFALSATGVPTPVSDVVIDYVVPIAMGGTNSLSNIQILSKEEALRKSQILADMKK